jgi:hypothetical protein
VTVPKLLKDKIWTWAKVLMEPEQNLPIPDLTKNPVIYACKFTSETAEMQPNKDGKPNRSGVATVGFLPEKINFVASMLWPCNFLQKIKNN